jgi:alpha-glucosidase
MQWDASPNAGFTDAEPWLPIAEDYHHHSVAAERDDAASILSLYRALIGLRRAEPALSVGSYTAVPADGDVLAYIREHQGSRLLIALNLGGDEQRLPLGESLRGEVLLTTRLDRAGKRVSGNLTLPPDEGVIVRLA